KIPIDLKQQLRRKMIMVENINRAKLITSYNFSQEDKLFFDTNIWLYLYGPDKPQPTNNVSEYSKALGNILKAKSKIYIDVLILSEFMNAYSRRKHKLNDEFKDKIFKHFRKSDYFSNVAIEISNSINKILKLCTCINTNLTSFPISH